ncbi:hypothetical protein DICVIV_06124 [Dictyocaulus viviparus]|uniref:Uncharacterized protein n=1 Tax=Dictyocaulus viviparus TaxID=29172 RepID=A0A0D8XZL5_DICVI|nr:hypothetical protein DICVIV_06124 [Dictyocaulus viviparus]
MSMYPNWTGDDSYWSNQSTPQGLAGPMQQTQTLKQPYDPLLYNQSYMNNMKNMLAAQWVENTNPFSGYNALQASSASFQDRSVHLAQPVFPWMKMSGKHACRLLQFSVHFFTKYFLFTMIFDHKSIFLFLRSLFSAF